MYHLLNMQDTETKIRNKAVLKKLKRGDLIRLYHDDGEHWAVYAGKDERGDKTIIHWWPEKDDISNPRITISSFWKFADNMIVEKGDSDCIHVKNVVKRAKEFMKKLEEEEKKRECEGYPDMFYSCEHFAKWCYYGLGGLDNKWYPSKADLVIDINRVKNTWEFVHGIFTNHTSDGQAIRRNVEVLGQLQPGDVIRFSRGFYEHWATYIGQDKDKTIPKSVIHWWDNDGASDSYNRIVPFWELAGNCKVEKFNSDHPDKVALTESETVKHAKDCISFIEDFKNKGLPLVNELFHCSEDFAKWACLRLMSKCRPAEPGVTGCGYYPVHTSWLFCKHIDANGCDLRYRLNKVLLDELELEACNQLFDPCSVFTRKKNNETLEKLKPGDFIKFVEKSCNHWGVYIDVGTFIHWTAECNDTEPCRTSCITIESVNTLKEAEKLEKLNCEGRIIDRAQVVEKVQAFVAKVKEGEKTGEDYSDLFNDCEHFATWCHYGLGNKRLKISRGDIEQIKDVRKFVQGDFSPIPWQTGKVYKMWQPIKNKTDIGKESYMKKARTVSQPKH